MSCNHDCANCDQKHEEGCFLIEPHKDSSIKKIIGIVSGKGGVGKSFVTASLASMMQKQGYNCAVLDGDITGPSMGKMFGITSKAVGDETCIYPAITSSGIQVISTNMLLEEDEIPVIWRGPIIANMVKQFYTDVVYTDVDYMFIDMPPGTGDVPLTVFQSIPLDGIIIVTSPQELVSMIVTKAYNMAKEMFKQDFTKEFFDQKALLKMLDDHYKGKKNNCRKIWTVYVFLIWYKEFFVDFEKTLDSNA